MEGRSYRNVTKTVKQNLTYHEVSTYEHRFPIRPVIRVCLFIVREYLGLSPIFTYSHLRQAYRAISFSENAFLRALFFSWNNSEGVCSNNGWHFEVSSQISPSWGHSSIYRGSIIAFISGYCSLLYPALLCGPNNLLFLITKAMLTY